MAPAGGLRARLIRDSFQNMVQQSLAARGWLDADRRHQPVKFIETHNWDEPIEFNSIAIVSSDTDDSPAEMGSNLSDDRWTFYIDIFAESSTLGTDISHEIKDILRGKLPSIGRTGPRLDVYDLTLAAPVVIFTCDIQDILVDRASGFTDPWMKNMFTVRADVIDTWLDETE